jgi:ABC-type uncharacterized transport system substrate-binding protein
MRLAHAGSVVAALVLLSAAAPALAHPHVLVDAKAEMVFDKGKLTAVRHIWQFDAAFTAFAVQGLDTNNDGKLSDAELAPLAKVNVDSLGEFGYFTYLNANGKDLTVSPPTEYWLEFHQGRLTLFYTLPLKTPVDVKGKTTLEVFDPEYFVAFNFVADNPITLDGAPAGCSASFRPPQELDARTMAMLATIPADQRILPPSLRSAASALANQVTLTCK